MLPLVPLLALLSCNGGGVGTTTVLTPGQGVFAEGCPTADQAVARRIAIPASFEGETAVGGEGDYLIANDHAAFIITEPDQDSTYWYYGGVVVDAVPMANCEPGEDRLDEVALVLGQLDLLNFEHSILKGFRAERVEVINDGSDHNAAILRATGTDDTHWLVEYELIASALNAGDPRAFSPDYGLEVTVDYILEPDSPVLRIDYQILNPTDAQLRLFTAALLSFGGTLEKYAYPSASLSLGGLNLDAGLPYIAATDGKGAYAWSVEGGSLATMRISGIDVAVDIVHAGAEPFDLGPGQGDIRTSFLAVGKTDGVSATQWLADANPEPLPDLIHEPELIEGRAWGYAFIEVHARAPGEAWGTMDEARADVNGDYTFEIAAFDGWDYRLVGRSVGRDKSEPVDVVFGSPTNITTPPSGQLNFDVSEGSDRSPARIQLERDDGYSQAIWAVGQGTEHVPPGTYEWTASRGYEFAVVTGSVTIPDDGEADIAADMVRVIDTTGYLSIDTHVHSSDSPDSRVPPGEQLRHSAAHGVDIMLRTEHEHIVDRSTLPADEGLSAWITTLGGQEVTATMPEHMTMLPVEPDGSGRGGFIEWYGMDIGELWTAMHGRSNAGINIFNHPGYLDLIGWDRVLGEPTLDDPTLLGLAPDRDIWAWNFDGVEVMNGHSSPFFGRGNHRFDQWQSFLNAGHKVIPIGCSDDHGGAEPGFARTYFKSVTDVPSEFEAEDVVTAMKQGQVVVSSGAFARVSIGDAEVGDTITDLDGGVELDLHIEAIPEIDVTHAVVFVNCDEVLSIAADDPAAVVKLDGTWSVPIPSSDATVTVAAFGDQRYPAGLPNFNPEDVPRVLTGAIYVDGDGDGAFSGGGGRECDYDLTAP